MRRGKRIRARAVIRAISRSSPGQKVLAVVAISTAIVLLLLALQSRVTMTVEAMTEVVRVRLADCPEAQTILLPPGKLTIIDPTRSADPAMSLSGWSLVRIIGPAELLLTMRSDTLELSGRRTADLPDKQAADQSGNGIVDQVVRHMADLMDEAVVLVRDILGKEVARPALQRGHFAVKGPDGVIHHAPYGFGYRLSDGNDRLRLSLRGEVELGNPPKEPNWDEGPAVATPPSMLIGGTVTGRDRDLWTENRIEIFREQLAYGDQLFTDADSDGRLSCKPDPTWALITTRYSPGREAPIRVIAHARRDGLLLRRLGGSQFTVGSSSYESLSRQSFIWAIWAAVVAITVIGTFLIEIRKLARDR